MARNGDDVRDVKKSGVGAEQRRTGGRVLHCGEVGCGDRNVVVLTRGSAIGSCIYIGHHDIHDPAGKTCNGDDAPCRPTDGVVLRRRWGSRDTRCRRERVWCRVGGKMVP